MEEKQDVYITVDDISYFLRKQGGISINDSPSMFKELLITLDDYEFVIDKIIQMKFIADGYSDGE
jgi:hypothetical protein